MSFITFCYLLRSTSSTLFSWIQCFFPQPISTLFWNANLPYFIPKQCITEYSAWYNFTMHREYKSNNKQVLCSSWDGWPFGHNRHTHTQTILRPVFWDHPGEPVPEENFWTLWCNGRLTEADTPTMCLGATPSGLISAHLHHPAILLQARCPSYRPIDMGQKLGAAPLLGELGPHVTQCGLGWGLPPYQMASWSIQPFGHNSHWLQIIRTHQSLRS